MKHLYWIFLIPFILITQQSKSQFNCYFCGFLTLENVLQNTNNERVEWGWRTDGEFDSDKFEVIRSIDNEVSYQVIGVVSAYVSTSGFTDYNFTDADPYVGRTSGRNYYRLRLYKTDGTFGLSEIRHIDLTDITHCETCSFLTQCQTTSINGPGVICNGSSRFEILNSPQAVTWSISNPNVVSITQRGPTAVIVTKTGVGEATLTATFTSCNSLN